MWVALYLIYAGTMQVNSQVVISAISMMNKLNVSSQLPWQ